MGLTPYAKVMIIPEKTYSSSSPSGEDYCTNQLPSACRQAVPYTS